VGTNFFLMVGTVGGLFVSDLDNAAPERQSGQRRVVVHAARQPQRVLERDCLDRIGHMRHSPTPGPSAVLGITLIARRRGLASVPKMDGLEIIKGGRIMNGYEVFPLVDSAMQALTVSMSLDTYPKKLNYIKHLLLNRNNSAGEVGVLKRNVTACPCAL